MLVDDDAERMRMLAATLIVDGHSVVARIMETDDLLMAVSRHQPEIILIDVNAPSRDTLESLGLIHREQPRPIVLFAARSDAETIRRAMRAGVSAYVVDGLSPSRLQGIMNVAIARFDEHQSLHAQLAETRAQLADRKDIDRAKGLLMQRKNLSEPEAYALLRKMAMDRGVKLGAAARILNAAAELL